MPKTKIREITHQLIHRYAAALRESEKSAATIRKYVRDLTVLCDYLEGSILTKTALIGWKEQLTSRYAPSSVNTMLAAMNGLLEFCGLGELNVKPLKIQKSMFTRGDKELTRGEYIRLVSAIGQSGANLGVRISCANTIPILLPRTTLGELVKNDVGLYLESKTTSLRFDAEALEAMEFAITGDLYFSALPADLDGFPEAKADIGSRPVLNYTVEDVDKQGKKTPVTVDFGKNPVSVMLPYTPQSGEKTENLCGVYVDSKGAVSTMSDSHYDSSEKAVIFSTNHFSTYGVGYKEDTQEFTDITNHWAKGDIEFVTAKGLLNGTDKTTFSPNLPLSRGMFVTAIGRLEGIDINSYKDGKFTDVKADAYYGPYANWAASKGITGGTGADTFSPNQSITRQEMAVFMSNYAKAIDCEVPKTSTPVTFEDSNTIQSWAVEAATQMQRVGVITGREGNRFDPTGTATRAEVSAVLHRYLESVYSVDGN